MKPCSRTGVLLLFTLLGACAEQVREMSYFPDEKQQTDNYKVWPSPPEVPRYRYAGELAGESNFSDAGTEGASQARKIFDWVVGLTRNNNARPTRLSKPQGGMVGPSGRVFVTDVGNQSIFVFDQSQGKLSIWDNADRNSRFISPIGIAANQDREILVADSELGRIVRLDFSGNPIGSFGEEVLDRPTGLAVAADTGHVYVADTGEHNIKLFDREGQLISIIGERGEALGQFNAPTFLCLGKEYLYVSDTLNARIQVMTHAGKPVKSIGQRGLYIGNFTRPKGITLDSEENIYVVESYYDHILIFNSEGEYLLPIGGTGTQAGNFFLPAGIWNDTQDRIYTADMLNGRVFIMQYLGD